MRGLFKNPLFYFGLTAFVLFSSIYFGSDSFASSDGLEKASASFFNAFFNSPDLADDTGLALKQGGGVQETPDLKIIQDNSLGAVSTIQILTPKVLGDIFGGSSQNRKDIIEHTVQPGETLQSIAQSYGISANTLLWSNSLTSSSSIKAGQILVILPVDGLVHIVKQGDTISEISKKYKSSQDDIIALNSLAGEADIYIGDVLIVPNGVMPPKSSGVARAEVPLADNFFIFPAQGKITQGLHWYNAVDVANKCGTPVYAAASGVVQRVKYGWNFGGGNYTTILHSSGVSTYYGHLMTIFVKPGDSVGVGDRIALIGGGTGTAGDGISTGCHVHFGVTGAKNPLARYGLGTYINLK